MSDEPKTVYTAALVGLLIGGPIVVLWALLDVVRRIHVFRNR